MRSVICCWCKNNAEGFESHVPLLFSGKRNQRLAFQRPIDVLLLSGYELLGQSYIEELAAAGYRVHDAGGLFREFAGAYPSLDQFGDYEKKCFLRWLVIAAYFPGEPIVHYDGDIVLNESPAVISELLGRRTVVLQGCPAVTVINDQRWFAQYAEQLRRFADNVREYSAVAWREREGWEISEQEKWAGQRSREIISSDQDLLSHLIHTDRIVQDRPATVMRDLQPYILFENPLFVHGYENNLRSARYERVSGIDHIGGKRVLVWHMQSDFTLYLAAFIFRREYLRLGLKRLSNGLEGKDVNRRLFELFTRHIRPQAGSRLNVYRYFFQDRDFSEVLTDKTWWHEGAFV